MKNFKKAVFGLVMLLTVSLLQSNAARADEYEPNYLTFTAEEDNSSVRFLYEKGSNFQYKFNDSDWCDFTNGDTVSLPYAGDKVSFKGMGVKTGGEIYVGFGFLQCRFYMAGKIAASGSVTSLTDGNGGNPNVELSEECYYHMFEGCNSLTSAPELPATTLAPSCYGFMFSECNSLMTAPKLPATNLAIDCYSSMFNECSSLKSAPELSATTLIDGCYGYMFFGCRSLTSAPKLPATTLAPYCYNRMFADCEKLMIATEKIENEGIVRKITIPAYDAEGACDNMFSGAGTETSVPEDLRVPSTPPMSGVTYYTLADTFSITYVLNGGTQAAGNPTKYIEGEGIQSFKSPTRSGYTFMGWFADSAFTKEVKEISTEANGDITLYAKWLKNPYTEKITVKNVTYQISFDSYDNALSVVLTKLSDKKATSVNIGKVKYNGKSYSVTEIGDNAFKNNKKLKTVTIGSSVKTIGKSAFSGCTALTSVKSGSKVTEIKASAFNGCKKLKSITLASSLKTIGSSAFTNCKALTKVTIGSKVNSIGSKAFKGCSALKSVTIKTTLLTDKNVGKEAFSGINSKATVKVPAKKLASYKKLLKKKGIKGKNQKIKK